MTLYYNKNSYEIKNLDDNLINGWIANNNPKKDNWILLPEKPGNNYYWHNGQWLLYNTDNFSISAEKIRLWLFHHNVLLSDIDTKIDQISDVSLRETTRIQWEYGIEITKNHPIIPIISQILNLASSDIDTLFTEAQSL